jgi:hypothetical protein
MARKKKETEYVIINEYQCPGFVDRSCSVRTASPLLDKGWGERRCEVVRSDNS